MIQRPFFPPHRTAARHFWIRGAVFALLLLLAAAPGAAADGPTQSGGGGASAAPPVVVELFTSQGCAACPPAEEILHRLLRRDDVLALSFHVDYWDYMGWRDPFADAAHTARQRSYVRSFREPYIYTPHFIIDGNAPLRSPDEGMLEGLIQVEKSRARQRVPLHLSLDGTGDLIIRLPAMAGMPVGQLWLARFETHRVTAVRSGENSGHTLDNYNVVRRLDYLGEWRGQAAQFEVSGAHAAIAAPGGYAALLQPESMVPIMGAGVIHLP